MVSQAFFAVCVEAVRALPQVKRGLEVQDDDLLNLTTQTIGPLRWLRDGKLLRMAGYVRSLQRESHADRRAHLALRACAPGDTAIAERSLEKESFRRLKQRAAALGVPPAWLCAA